MSSLQNFNESQSQQAYQPLYLQQNQHFKQLQRQELNQLKQQQEPWQQQQLHEQQWQQQQHLQMHQIAQTPQPGNVESNHNRSRSQEWNTHPVLPPIVSKDDAVLGQNRVDSAQKPEVPKYQHTGPNFPTENPIDELLHYLPRDSYLPNKPVRFSKEQELYLRRLILQGLKYFNSKKLKDLYMDLTGYDKHLTGFVEYHDMSLLLSKYQVM